MLTFLSSSAPPFPSQCDLKELFQKCLAASESFPFLFLSKSGYFIWWGEKNVFPLDVLRKFFYREESFLCSLCHINISLEANVVSNGVARYILKVSSILKLLLLLCSVIVGCSPFSIWIHWMGVTHLGTQLDQRYSIYFQVSCFSIKMICSFHVLSLQIKAHIYSVIHIFYFWIVVQQSLDY